MEIVEEALVPVVEESAPTSTGLYHVDFPIVVDRAGNRSALILPQRRQE
jgi:hypothetical protein